MRCAHPRPWRTSFRVLPPRPHLITLGSRGQPLAHSATAPVVDEVDVALTKVPVGDAVIAEVRVLSLRNLIPGPGHQCYRPTDPGVWRRVLVRLPSQTRTDCPDRARPASEAGGTDRRGARSVRGGADGWLRRLSVCSCRGAQPREHVVQVSDTPSPVRIVPVDSTVAYTPAQGYRPPATSSLLCRASERRTSLSFGSSSCASVVITHRGSGMATPRRTPSPTWSP
jgi:hypothetical protein